MIITIERGSSDWLVSADDGVLSYMFGGGKTVPDALRDYADAIEAYASFIDDDLAERDNQWDVKTKAALDPLLTPIDSHEEQIPPGVTIALRED